MSSLSSKALRKNNHVLADQIICLYKQGLILTPGEVLSWTKRIRKLTSTKHRAIILRIAHGDIFSSSRLHKFGLVDSPKCNNCSEELETINHRIRDCPSALNAWQKLEEVKSRLGLNMLSDLTTENMLGAKDRLSKLEFALNAELLHKLTSKGSDRYCPEILVKSAIKIIQTCENMQPQMKESLREIINTW